jgi:DHA2 family multidrug resistance protein-like MFS transporter
MIVDEVQTQIRYEPRAGRWWGLAALVLSGLVIGLDMTILITALPTLAARLGASTSQLQWFSDAYTLALGGLLLPAGVLGDRFGRRRLLLVGLALFGVCSVLAGQMTSANGLIVVRAFMGAGAALILPLSLAILPTLFSEEERPRAVALAAVGTFVGLPLGPLAAGWLLTHFAWGSIFLINAPVVALALVGVWLLVPESRDPNAPPLDWIGVFLSVVGVTAIVYGIIEEPGNGWADPAVLTSLVGGAAALVIFSVWSLRARAPLVDLRLFLNPRFGWATVAFAVAAFALAGALFILTPYLQIVQGNDPEGTGIRLLPMIAMIVAGALAGDRLTAGAGTKLTVAAGLLVTAAGLALLSAAGVHSGYALLAWGLGITGLGMGLSMPTALDAVLGSLSEDQAGAGTALSRTVQQTGASFGVAILGSILNNVYRSSLSQHLPALPGTARAAAISNIAAAVGVAHHLPAATGARVTGAAFVAYVQGLSTVLVVCAGLLVAGAALMLLFLPARPRVHDVGSGSAAVAEPVAR